ncbi:MAG: hypothetical protein ACI4NP_00615 [Thermoguttaceae bacterium]
MAKYIAISGTYDVDSNGAIRRLGRCSLSGNRNYKECVTIDTSIALSGMYVSYYDPTSKDLHKYRLFAGELRDDDVYGWADASQSYIYYDPALKEKIVTENDGEPLIESVDYNVVFSPYENAKIGKVDWIDESEGTFYYKPLKDGEFFKYAAIPIDGDGEDIPIFYFYLVKKYSEKVEDVGDCYQATYNSYNGHYDIHKYKLLRNEITDIELLEVPVIARKTIKNGDARITRIFQYLYQFQGSNNIYFDILAPSKASGGNWVPFSLKEEGEKTTVNECSYSDYTHYLETLYLEFSNKR